MNKSNTIGGKKHKKAKKHVPEQETPNEDIYAKKDQIYAMVVKRLGGTRIQVECSDGKTRDATIPGKFYKKVWLNPGDVILCTCNINDRVCYVVYKYTNKEANKLKSEGLIKFDILEEQVVADTKNEDIDIPANQNYIDGLEGIDDDMEDIDDIDDL